MFGRRGGQRDEAAPTLPVLRVVELVLEAAAVRSGGGSDGDDDGEDEIEQEVQQALSDHAVEAAPFIPHRHTHNYTAVGENGKGQANVQDAQHHPQHQQDRYQPRHQQLALSPQREMLLAALAGGLSGAVAKTAVAPLARLTILYQVHHGELKSF
jgi:hypothetical protein